MGQTNIERTREDEGMKPSRHYFRAGLVERGPDYHWCQGYAEALPGGGILYPWDTKAEARASAKRDGFRAVFHDTEAEARKALPSPASGSS